MTEKFHPRAIDTNVVVSFKTLNPRARLPTKETKEAVGYDLYSTDHVFVQPGERVLVGTGLQLANVQYVGTERPPVDIQIRPRSGLAFKHGVTVLNAPGTIDPDYRGEIKVLLINHGSNPYSITAGDRIAQMVISSTLHGEVQSATAIVDTDRGAGGFGSTGK